MPEYIPLSWTDGGIVLSDIALSLLTLGALEAEKIQQTKCRQYRWTPCTMYMYGPEILVFKIWYILSV